MSNTAEFADRVSATKFDLGSVDRTCLARVAERLSLDLVAVFGSMATGRAKKGSDLDVAFLPAVHRKVDEIKIWRELSDLFSGFNVDSVNLRRASALLELAVARDGVICYELTAGLWRSFQRRAVRQWEDAKRVRSYWNRIIDRTLAKGSLK